MSDELERRRNYVDIERHLLELAEIVKEHGHKIHDNDRAIAVLETQAKTASDRATAIELAINAIHEKIDELSTCFSKKLDAMVSSLAAHTQREDGDRLKLMRAIIATLVTGLITLGGGLAALAFEVLRRG
jgi:chromosome segregation ATPase